jgi:hypothetical protein
MITHDFDLIGLISVVYPSSAKRYCKTLPNKMCPARRSLKPTLFSSLIGFAMLKKYSGEITKEGVSPATLVAWRLHTGVFLSKNDY